MKSQRFFYITSRQSKVYPLNFYTLTITRDQLFMRQIHTVKKDDFLKIDKSRAKIRPAFLLVSFSVKVEASSLVRRHPHVQTEAFLQISLTYF